MTLSGSVVANGEPTVAWFEWGNNVATNYSAGLDVGSSSMVQQVNWQADNLQPLGIYKCSLVASNSSGVVRGAARIFTAGRGLWLLGTQKPADDLGSVVSIQAGGEPDGILVQRPDRSIAILSSYDDKTLQELSFTDVIRIGGGQNHSLFLRENGQVVGMGNNQYGQINTSSYTNVIDVAVGATHSVILRADGSVAVLGFILGSSQTPPPLTNVVEVAAGDSHCLALRANGTVAAWGLNANSQSTVPAGLTNVVAISAGSAHNMALRGDGTVICWGANSSRQTNTPAGLAGVLAISADFNTSCAIRSNLTGMTWGSASLPGPQPTNFVSLVGTGTWMLAGIANTPPAGEDLTVLGSANADLPIVLRAGDTNGEYLSYTVTALPERGRLFQYDNGARGPAIEMPGSSVTDWKGRVIFAPVADEYGENYASFRVSGFDGDYLSPEGTVTVHIQGKPVVFTQSRYGAFNDFTLLKGTINCNGFPTHYWFEWSNVQGDMLRQEPRALTNTSALEWVASEFPALAQGAVYGYRLVASNMTGVAYGNTCMAGVSEGSTSVGITSPSLTGATALSVGKSFMLALKKGGNVTASGSGTRGQTIVPPGLTNIIGVEAGSFHSLAIQSNGTLVVWGGQNLGPVSVPPAGLTGITDVAAGEYHSVALRADGTVACWGSNQQHQLSVPVSLDRVVKVAAGPFHTLALRSDGTLVGWGKNEHHESEPPAAATNIVSVSAGLSHTLALRADGSIVAWGHNGYGQCTVPALPAKAIAVQALAVGSLALLENGRVLAWGSLTPVPASIPDLFCISAGGSEEYAGLTASRVLPGTLACPPLWKSTSEAWLRGFVKPKGKPTYACFEWSTNGIDWTPTEWVDAGSSIGSVSISALAPTLPLNLPITYRVVATNNSGVRRSNWQPIGIGEKLAIWGQGPNALGGQAFSITSIAGVAAGESHGAVLRSDGTISQFGNPLYWTVDPAALSGVWSVGCGSYATTVVLEDGTMFYDRYGQLRATRTNIVMASAGLHHGLAVQNDGTVQAFGNTSYGGGSVPAGLTDATAVAAGWFQGLVLRDDGRLVFMGFDSWGSATSAASMSDVVQIASGHSHCLALHDDGTVSAFGQNTYGQCNVPPSATNVIAVGAGPYHSLALRVDGSILAWGNNDSGQVAPGTGPATFALLSGGSMTVAAGGNVAPIAVNRTNTAYVNADTLLTLPVWDPNGDSLAIRVTALPQAGSLYQFNSGGRGPLISQPGATITDLQGRCIFVPGKGQHSGPDLSFSIEATDGFLTSTAVVTVNVTLPPAPVLSSSGLEMLADGVQLRFSGDSNAVYSVWASTNLIDWQALGQAEFKNGAFEFIDPIGTPPQTKFYKAGAP